MKLIVTIFMLFVLGCATEAKYNKACESWIGKPADSLVLSWGVPTSNYTMETGEKYLVYSNSKQSLVGLTPIQGVAQDPILVNNNCVTTFVVKDGVISSYKWQGNNCRSE